MKLIDWFKNLLYIVDAYDRDLNNVIEHQALQDRRIASLRKLQETTEELMRERTEIHVDVPLYKRYPCTVVVCGRYKNNDYVEVKSLDLESFEELVAHLRDLSRHGQVRTVDAPPLLREFIRKDLHV